MVARSAGSFLGGFFNNPGLVAIALGIGALLVFRKPITEAFASIGSSISGGLGDININLPSINLPSFEFPDFNIDFGDLFGGFQD